MAIDELLDEHEQGERVRSWLRNNAVGLFGGVALGLALIGGWQWWQQHRHAQRALVGDRYDAIQAQLTANNLKGAQASAKQLPADSMYAALAALDIAKAQVTAGQVDAAIATLRAMPATDPALQTVIKQRLARLLIAANKPKDAIQQIGKADDAVTLEILGDALIAQGQRDAARDAYAKAYRKTDPGSPGLPLLGMKLSDAGGDVPASTPTR